MIVNSSLQLETTCSTLQKVTHKCLDQNMDAKIDVTARDAMLLPRFFPPTLNVGENGTILLKTNNGDKLFMYKYRENFYHAENSFILDQELKACRALLTPNSEHIVLSKIVRSGWPKKTETKTWIYTSQMEKETYHCGHFGDLLRVSNTRLLYKQDDANGTILSACDFNHEFKCKIVFEANDKKVVLGVALNPTTHYVAIIMGQKGKKGEQPNLVMYDSSGERISSHSSNFRKIEYGSEHFVVLSGKDELRFYDWNGEFVQSFNYAGVKCPYSIASFPPHCVCQSHDDKNRILHVLTRSTPIHRKCVVACRVDF